MAWDGKSPKVFGVLVDAPNRNGCNSSELFSDKAVSFDISALARLAGESFDVNKVYVDGIGSGGDYALGIWLDDWHNHGYGYELVPLDGLGWSSQNKVLVCTGSTVQGFILAEYQSYNPLKSIVLWYNGPISATNDNGPDMNVTEDAVTASGNGLTPPDLTGHGANTTAIDPPQSGKPDFIVSKLCLEVSP